MICRLLTSQLYRRMPWRNSLGTTFELARAECDPFDWRVSIADVIGDGPFSRFAGYDRIIMTISGEGMILEHPTEGESKVLDPMESYAFSGDIDTFCRLRGGAIRDFNVMTLRGRCEGQLSVMHLAGKAAVPMTQTTLLYCLEGSGFVASQSGKQIVEGRLVAKDDTLLVEDAATDSSLELSGNALVVQVMIRTS